MTSEDIDTLVDLAALLFGLVMFFAAVYYGGAS